MKHFLLVLIVLFVIAVLLRERFFFTVFYLLVALFLLSQIWARQTATALKVARRFPDRAFLGDRLTVDLSLHNRSRWPLVWIEINEILPVQLRTPPFYRRALSIGGRESRRVSYTLVCRRRGYYTIGPLRIRTGDLLGLHRNRLDIVEADHLIVYPRVVPLQRLGLPAHSPLAAIPARSPLFEDPSRIMGVRQYQRGDSPRRIHWSATASAGQLLVKQYQPAIARDTLICLDLNESHYARGSRYTATELAVVVAASIANHVIVQEGLAVGLAVAAWDPLSEGPVESALAPRRERGHLMAILELLARVQCTEKMPFAEQVRRESTRLTWGATVVVVTGSESDPLFDTLHLLNRSGFAVSLILVQANAPSPELRERARLLHIPLHQVWSEEEIEVGTDER